MKTATVRELRHHFPAVLRQVEDGEEVEISKHGKIVALLAPPPLRTPRKVKRPDFMARLKRIYGDMTLPQNAVLAEREQSRW